LHAIRTVREVVEDQGVAFVVRRVSSLARKHQAATGPRPSPANPFLPYEENLLVAEISDTHVCILNKFNVVEHHVLLVTRTFEEQESPLTPGDFEALWCALAELGGLGFYNAGAAAGASQRHKHLQMVPLPLAAQGPPTPIESLFSAVPQSGSATCVPGLAFLHSFVRFPPTFPSDPPAAAHETYALYRSMLRALAPQGFSIRQPDERTAPYNLLVTRHWMLLVPRSVETVDSISVNALGFAGALLVRDQAQMRRLKLLGPMAALCRVALRWPAPPAERSAAC
jgi:ATP adenylyltransferase